MPKHPLPKGLRFHPVGEPGEHGARMYAVTLDGDYLGSVWSWATWKINAQGRTIWFLLWCRDTHRYRHEGIDYDTRAEAAHQLVKELGAWA